MTRPETGGPQGGPPAQPQDGLRNWVFWTALRSPPNRRAAWLTLLIAAVVFGFSGRPLAPGYEIDLRLDGGGPRDATRLWGFGEATVRGRRLVGGIDGVETAHGVHEARVELPRALPASFVLLVEGESEAGPHTVEVLVDGHAYPVAFGRRMGIQRVEVDGGAGGRAVGFRSKGPATPIVLRRLMLQ